MSYPNRTICQVLDEMRKCYETYHFAPMAGLIEEIQSLANRMEASLYDKHDLEAAHKELKEIEQAIKGHKAKLNP